MNDIKRYTITADMAYPLYLDPEGDYVTYEDHVAAVRGAVEADRRERGEPVAWRYWNKRSRSWNTTTSNVVAEVMGEDGRAVEPLFTGTPQPAEPLPAHLSQAIQVLRKYQAWRTGEDDRTMDEAGIVPREITVALDLVLDVAENHFRDSTKMVAPQPAEPDGAVLAQPVVNQSAESTPYAWTVTGSGRLWNGEYAEAEARLEAAHIGGDCRAFPVYRDAQPVVNQSQQPSGQPSGNSGGLADTQRAIIEAAERRGYERRLAEEAQDQPPVISKDVQERLDALYIALEVCSAELFAQCGHQGRAMKYVEQARHALALEQCARAAAGGPTQLQAQPPVNQSLTTVMKEICPECGHQFECFHNPHINELRSALAQDSGQDREDKK